MWSTASRCCSDRSASAACASSPARSRSKSCRWARAVCRPAISWCTTRPTARWRSCSRRSSPGRSRGRGACCTATPRRGRRGKCTPRRRPRASGASPPTSGRCCAARGRGPLHRERESRLKPRLGPAALALLLAAGTAFVPADGRWTPAAPLPQPMQELSAAALHGRIYVAGGIDRSDHASAAAFRYDPTAHRWARIADLPAPRHHMPLAVVGDTLYAVGGLTGETFVPENTLWLYREDANRWEPRAPLPAPRGASGAAAVSGKLIVVGGWGRNRRLVQAAAIYDPAVDRWRDGAAIPTPRAHLAAAAARPSRTRRRRARRTRLRNRRRTHSGVRADRRRRRVRALTCRRSRPSRVTP